MRMRVPRSASICLFAVAFILATAGESNAQRLTPAMLCSWLAAPCARQPASTRSRSSRRTTARTRSTTTSSSGTSTRPTTSRSTTTPRTSSISSASRATPKARISRSAPTCGTTSTQRVPLIIFKTHSEFEQQNIAPGAAPEGVLAFAEGERNRMVLPIDLPSDLLYGLIVHELTHVFQYDIIPMSLHPPQHSAVGARRRRRIRARHLGSARSDDGARRRGRRHHPAHEPDGRLRRFRQPAPGLQPRPRAVRVHRSALGQGRRAAVPLLAAQERHRRRLEPVRRSVPDDGARVRPAVREISERSLQGVPRQGAAGRLRTGPVARPREDRSTPARSRSSRRRRATSSPWRPATAATRSSTSSSSRRRTARSCATSRPASTWIAGSSTSRSPSLSNMVPWMSWSPVGDRLAYFVRNEKYKTLIIQNVLTGKIEQRVQHADASTTRSRRTSRPTAARCCSAGCAARSAISSGSISTAATSRTSPTTSSPTTRPSTRPTAASSSTWRASADRRSCSASISTRARRRSSPSARRTRRRRSS